jgi:PPM family protein phosphatase
MFARPNTMIVRYHTEPGGKPENEDYIIARRHPRSWETYICLLADGQGGRPNGATAAKVACEKAWSLASELPSESLLNSASWNDILKSVDVAVSSTGGFTTLIAVVVTRDCVSGASVGDSKLYFKGPASNEIEDWTNRQRKNPPVGSTSADFTSFSHSNLRHGRILIVSDGAWKYAGYEALKSSFEKPVGEVASHIKTAIFSRGGSALPDDLSTIAIDFD